MEAWECVKKKKKSIILSRSETGQSQSCWEQPVINHLEEWKSDSHHFFIWRGHLLHAIFHVDTSIYKPFVHLLSGRKEDTIKTHVWPLRGVLNITVLNSRGCRRIQGQKPLAPPTPAADSTSSVFKPSGNSLWTKRCSYKVPERASGIASPFRLLFQELWAAFWIQQPSVLWSSSFSCRDVCVLLLALCSRLGLLRWLRLCLLLCLLLWFRAVLVFFRCRRLVLSAGLFTGSGLITDPKNNVFTFYRWSEMFEGTEIVLNSPDLITHFWMNLGVIGRDSASMGIKELSGK